MKSFKLCSIVMTLAVGVGCSRMSVKSRDASHRVVADREEVSLVPTQAKPSPCIKWEKGSKFSKVPRKAAAVTVSKDLHKTLQAKAKLDHLFERSVRLRIGT